MSRRFLNEHQLSLPVLPGRLEQSVSDLSQLLGSVNQTRLLRRRVLNALTDKAKQLREALKKKIEGLIPIDCELSDGLSPGEA